MKLAKFLRVIAKAACLGALLSGLSSLHAGPQLLPGVYGYGLDRDSNPAGFAAGSRVIHVTTIEDNGNDTTPTPGSLRAAVQASGPRVVVFDLSGVIELKATLRVRRGDLTIAGQTAPSPGIALHGFPLIISDSNVLIQHLRVRPGDRWTPDAHTHNRDALNIEAASPNVVSNVVLDHCTFGWSIDEMTTTWNLWDNVTYNKCIFAEPLFRSIHIDEGFFPGHLPPAVEGLAVTPVNFGDPVPAAHAGAVGGSYREWEATGDGATLDFVLPIQAHTSTRPDGHLVVGSITGPDRASFKIEVRHPTTNALLQTSEVFDQYAPGAAAVSHVARTDITGFTIPAGITSVKVRLTISGRNPASTGWKLGLDLLSISQGHAMGPLFSSGKEGGGHLALNGSVIAHILERGPWVSAQHFVFANNVLYNRRNRFVMVGNTASWNDPIHAALVGNTFIDGFNMGTSPRSAIARQTPPAGTQLFEADNVYDPGDRTNPAPLFDPLLEPLRVDDDPTAPGRGTDGFTPLPVAAGYRDTMISAGARPNDRDIMEARVMNEIAVGASIHALAQRPGKTKNSVVEAGGWPVYAENAATWTLPANPHGDDDSDGYTNLEEWLQELSAQLDGTPASGNNYQAEFARLGGGSVIVTNASGANGTGYVTAPAAGTLTFNKVDGTTGGARLLRIRYALDGVARSGEVVVNGTPQGITFAPTGGANTWVLLDIPVTLASGTNVVEIRGAAEGLPKVDDFTVTGTDIVAPVVTVPADMTIDATGADGAPVTFAVSALDAVDGPVTATATPASGSTFAPGATTVHVSATDASGNTTTRDFTVTVVAHAPVITTAPASQTVTAGDTVTFTVAATGTPDLTYDWQRGGVSLSAPSSPTLTLPAVETSAAGDYAVVVTNAFGSAPSAPAMLTVNKAPVAVTFGQLDFSYFGTAKPVTVKTVPDGLPVVITYNGSTTPPTLPGTYTVVATIDDPNFGGTATATLTILPDVLVNHAPTLNGSLAGSIQVLRPESITLNGNAAIGRQLLVPGTPAVQLNGNPVYGGATDGTGSASPTTHRVTLSGNARLGGLLRHVDAIALPSVSAPPAPAGTRNVTLNSAGQSAGDFATVRNLTLNGNAGVAAVPAGTYGNLTANGGSGFRLGVAGATTPAVYNLQSLTLNGSGALEIAGPVVLTLASGTSINTTLGNPAHPEWLEVRIASGGLTLNGNVACHGSIIAPNGTVTINGSTQLAGHVVADRFTINGNGTLTNPADQVSPTVSITAPAAGATVTGTVEVLATAADNAAVAAVQFKLDGAPLGLEDTSAPFGASWPTVATAPGSHALVAVARDLEGNFTTSAPVQVTVADQTAPTVALTAPAAGARLGGIVAVSATADDDVAVTGVQFRLDGSDFGPEQLAAPYAVTWDTASAAPGIHSLTATARDAAGHETTSAAIAIIVADQRAPSITLGSPVDGATVGGVVPIAAEVADDVGIAGVQFKLNGENLGTEVTAAPHVFAWDTLLLPETSYTLTAVARDAEGNRMESAPVTVNVRNVVFATFENGPVTGWTTDGGVWTVTEETGTHTWKQSDLGVVAYRATRTGTDWANQAVEADVKLSATNGSNRFFGVFARHQPTPNDYYYLILRTNNTIELKKLVNNISANLAPAVPFTVTPNTSYRLQLEVIGTTLKGYVNGQLKIQATDATFATGTGGLLTFGASVAFDDVHIDPTPLSPVLAADDFENGAAAWTPETGSWSLAATTTQVYRQTDAMAAARSVTGQPWTDQIVELDVTPQSFGQAGGWAGALFRYVDATHHYAVALREGNKLELLKVDGATVTTLATATTPVTPGTKVWLRLNAVGNSFKVYRDGALVLQAVDDTYPAGKLALATAGAAADFDDVSVIAP